MKLRERSLKRGEKVNLLQEVYRLRERASPGSERKRERGKRARENGEIRNNIVPRRDPSGKLPGGAPPAAFLETKRKLEETGGDWFQPVARRGARTGGDPLSP